ncbi:hypothetical protein P3T43_006764 [Paraburkholderia sp. GAS41]|jgi:hypothetical protein|uniref:DUF2255 family protein n=1 Tax=Paraburkholderia sp. GAS41 TaxID=3035134 RepID=UPI003D1E5AD0
MATWSEDEIKAIAVSDDLHVSPFRDDGVTCGTPTWVWSVVVDGDLYVRAYNGHASRWYQAAMRQRGGRISVAGMTRDVSFEPAVDQLNERIDAAYRAKYRTSTYLNSMTGTRSRAATVKILPRA